MRYGQKGGDGPTRGKKAISYGVTLPDGRKVVKRVFTKPEKPTGFAYTYQGGWFVVTVAEPGTFPQYTECPAVEVVR